MNGPINRLTNSDIHHLAVEKGVKLREIAVQLGDFTNEFFAELHASEMSDARKHVVVAAIEEVAKKHESQGNYVEAEPEGETGNHEHSSLTEEGGNSEP